MEQLRHNVGIVGSRAYEGEGDALQMLLYKKLIWGMLVIYITVQGTKLYTVQYEAMKPHQASRLSESVLCDESA